MLLYFHSIKQLTHIVYALLIPLPGYGLNTCHNRTMKSLYHVPPPVTGDKPTLTSSPRCPRSHSSQQRWPGPPLGRTACRSLELCLPGDLTAVGGLTRSPPQVFPCQVLCEPHTTLVPPYAPIYLVKLYSF